MSRLHHVCISTKEYEWYVEFFKEVFQMTVDRTAKEKPDRTCWFREGIQINERKECEINGSDIHHISIEVENIEKTVDAALNRGCASLPQGAHWFALPNGVKLELK